MQSFKSNQNFKKIKTLFKVINTLSYKLVFRYKTIYLLKILKKEIIIIKNSIVNFKQISALTIGLV